MSRLRRFYRPGQVYFITAVTHRRRPLLVQHFDILKQGVARARSRVPFEPIAWVVLPDHIHAIVDPGEIDLSGIVRRVKLSFANLYYRKHQVRGGTIWQRRFWDHVIRDQADMNRHLDYIHYNPVKHGLVADPFAWRYSTLDRYFREEYYSRDWGVREIPGIDGDFGE